MSNTMYKNDTDGNGGTGDVMDPHLVVVSGMPASGKNFAREYAARHGIPYLSTGDLIREEAKKRGLEPTGRNLAMITDEIKGRDRTALTKKVLERVEKEFPDEPLVILEGMRSFEEIELMRRKYPVTVVAFVAGRDTRRERYLKRGREDDDPALFDARDRRELGYGVGEIIALADAYVLNEGTPDEAIARFDEIVKSCMKKVIKERHVKSRC